MLVLVDDPALEWPGESITASEMSPFETGGGREGTELGRGRATQGEDEAWQGAVGTVTESAIKS